MNGEASIERPWVPARRYGFASAGPGHEIGRLRQIFCRPGLFSSPLGSKNKDRALGRAYRMDWGEKDYEALSF
jgi:hypothetical protein